jgi:predicted  nucleic acid-binding Zn-ribbon protein
LRITLPLQSACIIFVIFLLALFLPGAQASGLTEGLMVDFTNRESRSISLRLGSADGINAGMNFAVLDSADMQIAVFYPHEILTDRFWSGPLKKIDYDKITSGDRVIKINLGHEEAALLREQFAQRFKVLEEKRLKSRIEDLTLEKRELEELINDIDVESLGITNDLKSLHGKLKREKDLIGRQVEDLREQIDDLRNERSELADDRKNLLDKREDFLKRSNPPQDRISDLNEDIADLDREIGQFNLEINDLRDDIRDLREETRDLNDEIREVREEQRELELERKELNLELNELEKELMELQQKK